jgi:hypothetical protein
LHLRRIGAPLVVVIPAGADAIADEPADRGAPDPRGDALGGSAAELRADQAACQRADERARVFLRSWPVSGVPAHAVSDVATHAAAIRRTTDISASPQLIRSAF